jgi:C6 transcription factor Pro1
MSRSRSGCYTCRARKKKCDEQQPSCGGCKSSNLKCYGYDVAPPDWMQGKRNWGEIMATQEARELQSIAGAQYRARRREGKALATPDSCPQVGALVVSRQQEPESIWWDGSFCDSLPTTCKPPWEDARLLKLYLDFIFPIQFGFYPMSTPADHRWLMSGLCCNTARYHAALSISASFHASLSEPDKTDELGLNSEVAERQTAVLSALQPVITRFSQRRLSARDVAATGLYILEVMHQLLSLEVFSMLEGAWQLHHQATRTLLDTMHSYRAASEQGEPALHVSLIDLVLTDLSCPDTKRSFEFHLTSVAWIDVIANATYGSPPDTPLQFDYIPYLHRGALKTQRVMGCHSSVMASIAEITCLADWRTSQLQRNSLDTGELSKRATSLAIRLQDQVWQLEQQPTLGLTKIEVESRLVTLQFACAAEIYLHVVVHGASPTHAGVVPLVRRNLQMSEALPPGLVIRTNWAFTITGCLASESMYGRFRGLVMSLRAQNRPMGMIWKGLMVVEECWRLRRLRPELGGGCDWKMATQSLGKKILLV